MAGRPAPREKGTEDCEGTDRRRRGRAWRPQARGLQREGRTDGARAARLARPRPALPVPRCWPLGCGRAARSPEGPVAGDADSASTLGPPESLQPKSKPSCAPPWEAGHPRGKLCRQTRCPPLPRKRRGPGRKGTEKAAGTSSGVATPAAGPRAALRGGAAPARPSWGLPPRRADAQVDLLVLRLPGSTLGRVGKLAFGF